MNDFHEMAEDFGLEFFVKMPLMPPTRVFEVLQQKGYRGQDAARRGLSLLAYRHVKRLKQIYLEGVPRRQLPPKSNCLLMGPTGCGKTYLVEKLFGEILKLPTVIIDVTSFSETGYIGDDTRTILTRLLLAADGNPVLASTGIVCLDEFDKLASGQNCARFDGQGTTKDVSGFGVQRELLRMMESAEMEIPTDFNNSIYSAKKRLPTGDIAFIACGAFSGFRSSSLSREKKTRMGFKSDFDASEIERIAVALEEEEINQIENFHNYGFIPELMGRFSRIIALPPLDRDTLKQILVDNVIEAYRFEFEDEGIELVVGEEILDHIVDASLERQTGARGLNSVLSRYLEDAAFGSFGGRKQGRLTLVKEGDEVKPRFEAS